MQPHDIRLRVIVVGDIDVGKTSLSRRFINKTFDDTPQLTIDVDCLVKTIVRDGKTIRLEVWDTAGQERFRSISSSAYRMNDGVFLAFDISRLETFQHLPLWLGDIGRYAPTDVIRVLVGTKCDLANERQVSLRQVEEYCVANNLQYIETSAKDSINVDPAFDFMLNKMLAKRRKDQRDTVDWGSLETPTVDPSQTNDEGSGCPC